MKDTSGLWNKSCESSDFPEYSENLTYPLPAQEAVSNLIPELKRTLVARSRAESSSSSHILTLKYLSCQEPRLLDKLSSSITA